MPKGHLMVFSRPWNAARYDEFIRWYTHVHLPDQEGALGFVRSRRFVQFEPSGPPTTLALYEYDTPSLKESYISQLNLALSAFPRGRHINSFQGMPAVGGLMQTIDPETLPKPEHTGHYPYDGTPWGPGDPGTRGVIERVNLILKGDLVRHDLIAQAYQRPTRAYNDPKTTGIFLVYTRCKDPNREYEFNQWYNHIHLPDQSGALGFVRSRRFRQEPLPPASAWAQPLPATPGSTYLAIYEYNHPDLKAALISQLRLALAAFPAGRHIDCIEGAPPVGGMWRELEGTDFRYPERVGHYPHDSLQEMRKGVEALIKGEQAFPW